MRRPRSGRVPRYLGSVDGEQFLERLRQEFPVLVEELDEESSRELLYVQLGAFARYVQRGIDAGAKAEVERCFAVADRANREGDVEVQNAIGVAFLEHLNFQDGKVRRAWAFALLPAGLKAVAGSLGIAAGYRRP
jgi:hypothetical protein